MSEFPRPFQNLLRILRHPIALLLLFACIETAPGWLPGRVYLSVDCLNEYAPWRDPRAVFADTRNFGLGDHARQFAPWMIESLRQIRSGSLPFWNPYQQLGVPLLGNGQSAIFYPTTLLHLFLPPTWSWTISAVLRLWMAGIGVWLLARGEGLSKGGAFFAAASFMLCGFNIALLNHPLMNVLPWLGWSVWLMQRLISAPTRRDFCGAVTVLAIQFLGGHPESSVHLLLTCAMLFASRAIFKDRQKTLAALPRLAGATIIAAMIASVALVPMLDYVSSSATLVRRTFIASQGQSVDWAPLLSVVFPYAIGYPPDPMRLFTSLGNNVSLASGYTGWTALLLVVIAIVLQPRDRRIWIWSAVGLISLAYAMHLPPIRQIAGAMPGIRTIFAGRQLIAVSLAVSIIGGLGLDALADPAMYRRLRASRITFAVLAALISVASLIAITVLWYHQPNYVRHEVAVHPAAIGSTSAAVAAYHRAVNARRFAGIIGMLFRMQILAIVVAAGAIMLGAWVGRFRARAWIALSTVELLVFGIPFQTASPVKDYFPITPAISMLKIQLARAAPFRISGLGSGIPPDIATAYKLDDIGGYDAVTSLRLARWIQAVFGLEFLPGAGTPTLPDPSVSALRLLNLRYLVAGIDVPPPPAPWVRASPKNLKSTTDAIVYENTAAMPRAWLAESSMRLPYDKLMQKVKRFDFDPRQLVLLEGTDNEITHQRSQTLSLSAPKSQRDPEVRMERADRVVVNIPRGSSRWLILADAYFSGWKAAVITAGGKRQAKIEPAYGLLRAVEIPEVTREAVRVVFTYQPQSWMIGRALTAIGFGALVLWISVWWFWSRRRRSRMYDLSDASTI